jgi:F-type H+-transporting ATPase subunit b
LSEVQKGVADAQKKADQIRADGKARADAIRLESEQRTIEEIARMKQAASSDLANEASRVSDQLRRETALKAIEAALAGLSGKLDEKAQAKLIDQSIQTLGNS